MTSLDINLLQKKHNLKKKMDNLLLKLHFVQMHIIEYFNNVKLADRANFKMSLVLLKSLGLDLRPTTCKSDQITTILMKINIIEYKSNQESEVTYMKLTILHLIALTQPNLSHFP